MARAFRASPPRRSDLQDPQFVAVVQRALAGHGMEDRADVSAALRDVRLVITDGEEDPPVSGLAVAQFNRANAVAQLLSTTENGLSQAKELYLLALETESEMAELTQDPLAAKVYAALCSVCQALGEFDEALEHATKAVAVDRVLVGAGSTQHQLAMSLNALATCHAHVGNDTAAVDEYRKAIDEYRGVVSAPQLEEAQQAQEGLAMALNNLGMILAKLKQYDEAKTQFQESVERREASIGPRDESVIRTLRHLLQVCELAGDLEEADNVETKLYEIENQIAEDAQIQEAADAGDLLVDRLRPN